MSGKRISGLVVLTLSLALCRAAGAADAQPVQVGASGTVTLSLAEDLRTVPVNEDADLIVSLARNSQSTDGPINYTITYVPTRTGTFDLRDYLRTADGKSIKIAAPLTVSAFTSLPADADLNVADVPLTPMPRVGGYKALATAVVVCWAALLVPLIFWKRKPRVKPVLAQPVALPPTADEQLAALVRKLRGGQPTLEQKLHLETLLLDTWRRRFGLTELPMIESLRAIQQTSVAGVQDDLESYLHAPGSLNRDAMLANLLDASAATAATKGRA